MAPLKSCLWACLLLLSLGACHQQPVEAGWLRVGLAHMPMTLDPRYATDAASQKIQAFVHRGLVRQDAHFLPRPDLALSWRRISEREWSFTLRRDVYFHDGTRLTAEDVAETLRSILDAARNSPLRASFQHVTEVQAVDAWHLRLRLDAPDASLLHKLTVGILPQRIARLPRQMGSVPGCGPFAVQSWRGNRLLLRRVKAAPAHMAQYILFLRVKDAVTRALKLARGEIDFMQNDFPLHMLDYLRTRPGVRIAMAPSTTFSYIGMNLQDPLLRDVHVRQALMLAINRRKLKQALLRDAPVLAETVLTPSHWAAAHLPRTAYDPKLATKLLDEAGLRPGSDGWRAHLVYRTSTNPERLRLATAIADQWRRVGLDVRVESLEWGAFYARIKRGDFQLFSLSWVGVSDPDIYRWILHSRMWPPAGANRGRYRNEEVDAWLDSAERTQDMERRANLYRRVQRRMHKDWVYLPLWYKPVVAVGGPCLRGFAPRPDASLLPLAQARLSCP